MNKLDIYNLSLFLLLIFLSKVETVFEIGIFLFPLIAFIYYLRMLLARRKNSIDQSRMILLNAIYKTFFGVGLLFIFKDYPGKDTMSMAFLISILIAVFYVIGNGKVTRTDKYAVYIYLNFYILCYFLLPKFI